MKLIRKSMQKKQWTKNKEVYVGKCDWCKKDLHSTDSFVKFATGRRSCLKCYHNSGASLPMFNK